MAAVAIAADEIAAYGEVLDAATVDTVTITRDDVQRVTVRVEFDAGTDPIYFTTNGTTPTVGGKKCHRVPAVVGAQNIVAAEVAGSVAVKLISAGASTYSLVASD